MRLKSLFGWFTATRPRRIGLAVVSGLVLLWFVGVVWGVLRPLPDGVSVVWPERAAGVEFLADLTYERDGETLVEQEIFDRIFAMIDSAQQFIVVDMFLFDGEHGGERDYIPLSALLAERLIARRDSAPGLQVVLITDEINNFYGSYTSPLLSRLEAAGVQVVITDLTRLRDSNPMYSSLWRTWLQWFGTRGDGFLPHPLSSNGREVTLRSYLKILNFKANHRKILVTENGCVVASANPHDASSFHSNIAFATSGGVCQDVLDAERSVAAFSGVSIPSLRVRVDSPGGDATARLVTEGEIETAILDALSGAGGGDSVDLAMFYLSDRDVVRALRSAAARGAEVRIVLDPNKDAFGREKGGIPNRQVASELIGGTGSISVRWYDTDGEQFHTKLLMVRTGTGSTLIGGSANFTRRNIGDYNLEADLVIRPDSALEQEIVDYFNRIWSNEDGLFTVGYEEYRDDSPIKKLIYRFQEWSGFSSY